MSPASTESFSAEKKAVMQVCSVPAIKFVEQNRSDPSFCLSLVVTLVRQVYTDTHCFVKRPATGSAVKVDRNSFGLSSEFIDAR